MGFLDKAKKSLTRAVDQHGDKIEQGADQLGRTINARTGNKHADKIQNARDTADKHLGRNDGDAEHDIGRGELR